MGGRFGRSRFKLLDEVGILEDNQNDDKMQGHDHRWMPMPQPGSVGMPTTNYGSHPGAYGPPQNSSYGATTYGSHIPHPSSVSLMDREMKTLIDNLKVSIEAASLEELDILLQNEDKLNTLIEETPQVG